MARMGGEMCEERSRTRQALGDMAMGFFRGKPPGNSGALHEDAAFYR